MALRNRTKSKSDTQKNQTRLIIYLLSQPAQFYQPEGSDFKIFTYLLNFISFIAKSCFMSTNFKIKRLA